MSVGIEDIKQSCLECGRECSNRRSLGNHVARSHKEFNSLEDYVLKHVLNCTKPICKCGCKKSVSWHKTQFKFNDYISGHNPAGFKIKQPKFTKEQIEKRNTAIKESYKKNKEQLSKKISDSVKIAMNNCDFDFKEHMRNNWKNDNFVNLQHESRVKSWQGEADETRKEKVFTPEFGRKISLSNMNRDMRKESKAENKFSLHIKSFLEDKNDIETSKWFNFTEKTWCADVWIPSRKLIIEFDGTYWHALDRDKDYDNMQLSGIANDIRKNRIAKEKKLNLIRISEDSNWESSKSIEDLIDIAYHVVVSGTVVKEGTKKFEDKTAIITRNSLLLRHLSDSSTKDEITLAITLPALRDVIREHSEYWGWFYPQNDESLSSIMSSIKKSISYEGDISSNKTAGSQWLKSRIKSFWEVDKGPVESFKSDNSLNGVLKYRLGLNKSIDYTYKLDSGETVTSNEHFDISLYEIRKGFVVQRKSVSWFKPTVAASIWARLLCDFKSNSDFNKQVTVYDPSAGWGARLLGFASLFPNGKYVACEPASKTKKDLDMLSFLLKNECKQLSVNIHKQGSEKDISFLDDNSCDAVFTSPPYFDVEKYFDEPGQCWKDYPTLESWKQYYLVPTFQSVFRVLKKNRKAAFNVNLNLVDDVLECANLVGFTHVDTWNLKLSTDHFHRANNKTKKSEPVLIFTK
jgi:hypothetical protein